LRERLKIPQRIPTEPFSEIPLRVIRAIRVSRGSRFGYWPFSLPPHLLFLFAIFYFRAHGISLLKFQISNLKSPLAIGYPAGAHHKL
jgi:hypothetical protein